jgi:hypothetical protein
MHQEPAERRSAERGLEDDRRQTLSLAPEAETMGADVDDQPGCFGVRQMSCKQG